MAANSSAIRGISIPTPGARVVVRDAEWIVRRVDHAPGGYQIVCDGVSELVRGREAVFLTALEPTIQVLDPAETKLVPDASAQFTDSILYMESQLRQAVPNDENIHVGHTAAMDLVDYQLDPARLALARPRQRILIADAVGLGKTLEAGILVSELVARGRGRRILVLAVKSMLTQFQKEFWNRFTIPLTRLDSVGIQRVRSRIPTNHNPFHYYDKAIISIDTLKQDAEYRVYLEQATWDVIVIDEAHNVADRGTASQRNRLARLLARRSDTLIMLSATPHDGKARSFASLVNMLDATAITNPDDYTKEDFRPGLVIRRFKKDVQEQVCETFKDRKVHPRRFPASAAEEAAFDPADRLVIFTERIATLRWLKVRLARDLDLESGQVETLHGGMSDVDQQRVVEDFGNTQRPVRLLVCSDVASEGINLHYQCHRLIHFDMPWSLMVFQQRNGRVDRYGQDATPQNEAIRYLREVRKERVYRLDDKLAGKLGQEALRYMYRLLFLFYIEARPELGYAPVDSEAYRKGYSLEHLRDLELVRLTGDESLNGWYIHESVQTLFRLIRDGFDGGDPNLLAGSLRNTFQIRALDSALFRKGATPLLDTVKLRNEVLQRVIRLMSLNRPAKGRSRRRGRISYAQLGINQLGAVYEALLSYRGFFAEEDLYEVKQADKDPDVLRNAWFVPLSELHKYSQEERVFERGADGLRKIKVHPRGRFIYRLAGRDREKTASYYTPESLTRCVVKYALKELIPDDMPASRILDLTICEPAMGSAAFLNEAVNQLAEKYLDRRQRELGRRIPHAEYADELQKAKHFITDRNVYGVDLNPVARELAEVSLWLNCIHKDGHVPWFGFQLVCGNSLVGARRQVYESAKLGEKVRRGDRWFNVGPERVTAARAGAVYHFLLPDPGMADYRNKFYGRSGDGGARGGFDLVLGNPPWIKVEWKEAGVLGDFDPSLALRKHSAVELTRGRDEAFLCTRRLASGASRVVTTTAWTSPCCPTTICHAQATSRPATRSNTHVGRPRCRGSMTMTRNLDM